MAHALATTDGKTAMMYAGETPWHGLGTKLDEPASSREAIEAAGLDYRVELKPIYTGDGTLIPQRKPICEFLRQSRQRKGKASRLKSPKSTNSFGQLDSKLKASTTSLTRGAAERTRTALNFKDFVKEWHRVSWIWCFANTSIGYPDQSMMAMT